MLSCQQTCSNPENLHTKRCCFDTFYSSFLVNSKAATRKSRSPENCSSIVTVLKHAKNSLLTESVTNRHVQLAGVSLSMPAAKANTTQWTICTVEIVLLAREIHGVTTIDLRHVLSRTRFTLTCRVKIYITLNRKRVAFIRVCTRCT